MSKAIRRLLLVFAALAALTALGLGVMSTSWFQRVLERRVVASLERFTGGRVELREFHFRPAILQATFRGLVLHAGELPKESPLFSARTIVVRLSPRALWRRKLILRSLDWDEAEIHLYTRSDSSTNLPSSLESSPSGGLPADLSIRRLTLARTQFCWNEQRLPLELSAANVAILVRRRSPQLYVGSISSSETRIESFRQPIPPLGFTARFEFSGRDLKVTSLEWQSAGLHGGATLYYDAATRQGRLSFQGAGEIAKLAQSLRLSEIQGGRIEWRGEGSFEPGKFAVRGQLQSRQLMLGLSGSKPCRIDLSTDYHADRQHVELSQLKVSAFGGTTQGRAEIVFSGHSPKFTLNSRLQGLPLRQALQSVPGSPAVLSRLPFTSQIQGTLDATWNGQLSNLDSRFNLQFRSPAEATADTRPLDGSLRGRVRSDHHLVLQVDDARFQTAHSSITAHGKLGVQGESLVVELTTDDFEAWRAPTELVAGTREPIPLVLKSKATFSGEVTGELARPAVQGQLEVGPFEYRHWDWDSLEAKVSAAPNLIKISSARLRREASTITGSGSATLEGWKIALRSPADFTVRVERTPLEGLKAALDIPYPISGALTGRLDLEGTPLNLSGAGDVEITQGLLADEPFNSLVASLRITQSVWSVEHVELTKGQGRVQGQAQIDPSKRAFAIQLHGQNLSLADFKRLSRFHGAKVQGRGSFDLRGQGTPDNVSLLATWQVADANLNNSPLGNLQGQIDWSGAQMKLEGRLEGAGGSLHFAGAVGTEGDWPLDAEGQYGDFRADPWIGLFMDGKFRARTTARGTFRVSGPLKNPGELQIQSRAESLEVSFPSAVWKNDQPIDLRYANQTLTASRFRVHGPSTDLEVEGSIGFQQAATLSLTAQGRTDATLLSLMDPALQASGACDLQLRVRGTPAQPLLNGTLKVQDVNLSYGDLPFRLTGLSGEIGLEGDRATIRSLKGTGGGGAVSLAGFATFAELPRFNIQVALNEVRVRYPSDFTSVLDGTLRLAGTSERGQLGGELTVRQIFANESANLLARLGETAGSIETTPSGIASPIASQIRLNVQVSSAPSVRLETQNLRLVADVDLRIQGTLANPVQVGSLHILSGEAVFRGNRYTLTRGDISMTNPFRTQPTLDLEARTRVQRYELTLNISGPPDRLKFSYRSDPPLPTEDVLSLLAFGYARQAEEMSTAPGQPVGAVGASALLSEALSTQLSGRIQRLFGVSRIKIDPNVGAVGSTGGARVTVEQRVTRDLTVTYVTTTSSSQQRTVEFEWALSDSVSLVGARDQNGILGMELRFRQRFK